MICEPTSLIVCPPQSRRKSRFFPSAGGRGAAGLLSAVADSPEFRSWLPNIFSLTFYLRSYLRFRATGLRLRTHTRSRILMARPGSPVRWPASPYARLARRRPTPARRPAIWVVIWVVIFTISVDRRITTYQRRLEFLFPRRP